MLQKNIQPTTEIEIIFQKQKANRWKMANTTADERIGKLIRLRDAIMAHREDLQNAIHADYGKHPSETDITEIYPCISEINHTISSLRKWMKPKRVSSPLALFGTRSEIRFEPRGMVLILSPWNYPFNLLINPLVAAMSAGNCCILKPSSKVPNTSKFLKTFISGIFDESEVALFEGSSAISNDLLKLPFDHIFFTGSPKIGKDVMAAAAKHLATVTLELGGKSPAIIDQTADIRKTAERLMWGKFINAGQTCVAPDFALIHQSKLPEFLKEARTILTSRYGKSEEDRKSCPYFARLVSDGAWKELTGILQKSVAQGARIEVGGESDAKQRYIAPTLLSNVTLDTEIMKNEIFGPILPILTYNHLDEVYNILHHMEKPLAFYLFSEDKRSIERILHNSTAGGTCVNSAIIHLANPELAFGGVGQSGMGHYHGFHGFRALSHERAVLHQTKWFDALRFFYPPYTPFVKKLIDFAINYL
ncbi:MAG: aldehyde dehydrogenase [Bdellovibrionales bacterium GWA2_49_15]|nr:MAG: aldehyde dehydrogenase [Bdellovibrionales bacterium GWA2_49_15]HAZ12899.1 aldehyde dehydrogenase family protein [Bdellovibrionales bacterium]